MSDDLLKRMARALAEADGNKDSFDACGDDPGRERDTGCLAHYMNEAERLLRTSGLAAEIYRARYQPVHRL